MAGKLFPALLAMLGANTSLAVAQVPLSERENLIALFKSSNGTEWVDSTNWCKNDCPTTGPVTFNDPGTECTWFGIQCDSDQAHVIAVSLPRNGLSGSLPPLDGLPALKQLYLVANDLNGKIPSLAGLPALESLVLITNHFSGPLPALEGHQFLDDVDVNNNQIEGPLPSLNIPTLTFFNISNNRVGGTIPAVSGLVSIGELALGGNELTGSMPDLTPLTNLQIVTLGGNHLTGTLTPAPSSLLDRQSTICPNAFSIAPTANDAGWNRAAVSAPWWQSSGGCDELFFGSFDD